MFITNGYQALIDHRPRETLNTSTLKDRKSIPSFDPEGRVTISLRDDTWVLDIRSSHENRLLVLALVKYFILRDMKELDDAEAVKMALIEIASYGVTIRKLSPIVENPESFIYDFRFVETIKGLNRTNQLKGEIFKRAEFISTIIRGLLSYPYRLYDIDTIDESEFKGGKVIKRDEGIYIFQRTEQATLILSHDGYLFLTNMIETEENKSIVKKVILEIEKMKESFMGKSKVFTMIMMRTIHTLIRNKIQLRPAMVIRTKDGELFLHHRAFLLPEKTFDSTSLPIRTSASLLLEAECI